MIELIKVKNTEVANKQEKPDLGIDVAPVGLKKVNRNKVPASIPDTFYDLFYPGVDKNKDGVPKKDIKFYTFSALLATYMAKVFPKISDKAHVFDSSELTRYFKNNGAEMAKHVKVKRVNMRDFQITLPLLNLKLSRMIENIDFEDSSEETEFYRNFWKKKITGMPFDLGSTVDTFVSKHELSPTPISSFSKANSFWSKYLKGYQVTSDKTLPNEPISDFYEVQTGRHLSTVTWKISAIVNLPYEEARYYVQSEHPKEFELLDYVHSWYTIAFSSPAKNLFPTFKHSMVAIRQKNLGYAKKSHADVNEDKLALTNRNVMLYIPTVDYVDAHRASLVEATYNEETDEYSYEHQPSKLPRFQLVYTDWVNKRVAYTTAQAKLNSIDLRVLYPVKATNYLSRLNAEVTDDFITSLEEIVKKAKMVRLFTADISSANLETMQERFASVNRRAARVIFGNAAEHFQNGKPIMGLHQVYSEFADAVNNKSNEFFEYTNEGAEYFSEFVRIGETPTQSDYVSGGPFYLLTNYLRALYESIFSSEENILTLINDCNRDVPTTLAQLALLQNISKIRVRDTLVKLSKVEREAYLTQDDIDPSAPVALKNFEGVEAFMRHQATTVKKLSKAPKFAIIGVQAGGGKTLICIADILQALENGHVKKPLVLCPNNLIKDYVNESIFAGNGKLNAVALDSTVFSNYAEQGKDEHDNVIWDYSRLEALVTRAPKNTLFVVGYDVISGSPSNKIMNVYGSEVYESYTHLDFLGRCGFDGVWADESHYLKGGSSLRAKVNELLINKIPFRRLLTGTIVPNVLLDLVKQVGLFDPSILGTEKQFMEKYGEPDARGFVPRKDALREIAKTLKSNSTYMNVSRKEWAAFLPKLSEHEAFASLTPNQKIVYGILIGEAIEDLKEEHKDLEAILEDDSVSEENDEKLEEMLGGGSLAAVESFLSNPESAPQHMKDEFLKNSSDLVSPKGKAVSELIDLHVNQNPNEHPGKILVFCNTHAAVAGIWNSLPSGLKAVSMVYSAAKKADHELRFKTDDSVRVLIGVSKSLETGLNLQAADTIIRVDTVWTPGNLEQGNARVNRPKLKGEDFRMEHGINIYYVLVDGTIDTIKWAKLTSKTVTLAKFYSQGTPDEARYAEIGYDDNGDLIKPLKASYKLLREGLTQAELQDYKAAYEELRSTEHTLYEEYRNKNPEYFEKVPIKHTGVLEGSKLLKNVPYVAGAGVFNSDQLGLEPYLVYKRKQVSEEGLENWNPAGLSVHTEFGDGKVIKETSSTVHIRMPSGLKEIVKPDVVFVVTKKITSTLEIKDQIAKATGLKAVDIQLETFRKDKEVERLEKRLEKEKEILRKQEVREQKRKQKEREAEERKQGKMTGLDPTDAVEDIDEELEEDNGVELKFTPVNEMLALTIYTEDPKGELSLFKPYGFKVTNRYLSAEIRHVSSLEKLLDKLWNLQESGAIDMPQNMWNMWAEVEGEFSQGRSKLLQVKQVPQSDIKNFLRINHRRVRVPNIIRAYPMIIDKKLHMVINVDTHNPSTLQKVRRLRTPGVKWEIIEPELTAIFSSKQRLHNSMKAMEKDGWDLLNKKDIKSQLSRTKIIPKKRG